MQRLLNGNTLICEGVKGRLFEVTASGDIVWEYVIPIDDNGPVEQGTEIPNGSPPGWLQNAEFRAYRYAPDYPGLEGVDLTPGSYIELPAG